MAINVTSERELMEKVIEVGRKSHSEGGKPRPEVGALLLKGGGILDAACRGEIEDGEHAEFTLLERKLRNVDVHGATLYTTLEPCTSRNHPKSPCVDHIIRRGIAKVLVGIRDPDLNVYGKGILRLKEGKIEVEMFPSDLQKVIEDNNSDYIKFHSNPLSPGPVSRRLDDWYYTINSIYFDRNYYRDVASIVAHLVEIVGGFSLLATRKYKPDFDFWPYLAKAIAWWFALCGKLNVGSVEDLLWLKFPYVCPYCARCPHVDAECADAKAKADTPDWHTLQEIGSKNFSKRPASLREWQRMFLDIYPISQTEAYDVVLGRFTEELGELSEAIRVFRAVPSYVLSEAADVFAWLMHLVNFMESSNKVPAKDRGKLLEQSVYDQYPDRCKDCGQIVCACPVILSKTLGRIAREGPTFPAVPTGDVLVSPPQMSAKFDIGIKQIPVGSAELKVTSDLITEIHETSCAVMEKIRTSRSLEDDTKRMLVAGFERLGSLAGTQRLNGAYVDNILRVIMFMNKGERDELLALLGSHGPWTNAVQEFIRAQKEDPTK